jgi:hypothetical protein
LGMRRRCDEEGGAERHDQERECRLHEVPQAEVALAESIATTSRREMSLFQCFILAVISVKCRVARAFSGFPGGC